MKTSQVLSLLTLISLSGCGNTPFDEDYWDDPSSNRSNNNTAENSIQTYNVTLTSLSSANLGNISGSADIDVNETDVSATVSLDEVPQNLMIGQRSLSNTNCADIASAFPPPAVVTSSTEFKSVNEVDNSSREALIADLNQADGNNGDSVNLAGKSYVVKAYVQNLNTPQPTAATLFPIACGTIEVASGTSGGTSGDDNEGTAIGGSGDGGADTGGTVGGTTAGSVGGSIGGTIGGL